MNYKVNIEREVDPTQISIAIAELNCALRLLEYSRNNEVDFYRHINYAKELQSALFNIEIELKKIIRNK